MVYTKLQKNSDKKKLFLFFMSRPPYSFIEDNSRTSEMAIERDKDKNDQRKPSEQQQQQQQQHQQQQQQQPLHLPLFTLEHPFANHAFYDDEDYLENEAAKDGQSGEPFLN
jgi:hypothetical protein